ncbi:MAG: hypothetical protein ACRC1R_10405 [Cetobacterium sp.]|uniref:hypothetical protein n=1 Tax=Cetobacterium sp. TaxID=2071632 RepID=UPI003F31A9E9
MENLKAMPTLDAAKTILQLQVIPKAEKSILREESLKQELADDERTLAAIMEDRDTGVALPETSPYKSYGEWIDQLNKEIKTGNGSLERIEVTKAELLAAKYFIANATEIPV